MTMEYMILNFISEKVKEFIECKFQSCIIQRWSKYRAENFFNTLIAEMIKELKNITPNNLNQMISEIFEDETKSEILFDAYRRVVLSASKELGPRIIGILTAKLIAENRYADEFEERIAMAAEILGDKELKEYCEYYNSLIEKLEYVDENKDISQTDDGIRVELFTEEIDSNWSKGKVNMGPLSFVSYFGTWAMKLKNLGIMEEEIIEEQWEYKADLDRHIDMDGSVRKISWWLIIPKQYRIFSTYILKAIQMDEAE